MDNQKAKRVVFNDNNEFCSFEQRVRFLALDKKAKRVVVNDNGEFCSVEQRVRKAKEMYLTNQSFDFNTGLEHDDANGEFWKS